MSRVNSPSETLRASVEDTYNKHSSLYKNMFGADKNSLVSQKIEFDEYEEKQTNKLENNQTQESFKDKNPEDLSKIEFNQLDSSNVDWVDDIENFITENKEINKNETDDRTVHERAFDLLRFGGGAETTDAGSWNAASQTTTSTSILHPSPESSQNQRDHLEANRTLEYELRQLDSTFAQVQGNQSRAVTGAIFAMQQNTHSLQREIEERKLIAANLEASLAAKEVSCHAEEVSFQETDAQERSKSHVKIAMLEADIDKLEKEASSMREKLSKLKESQHVEDNNVKVGLDRLSLAESQATIEAQRLAHTVDTLRSLTDKLTNAQERCLNAEQEKVSGGVVALQEKADEAERALQIASLRKLELEERVGKANSRLDEALKQLDSLISLMTDDQKKSRMAEKLAQARIKAAYRNIEEEDEDIARQAHEIHHKVKKEGKLKSKRTMRSTKTSNVKPVSSHRDFETIKQKNKVNTSKRRLEEGQQKNKYEHDSDSSSDSDDNIIDGNENRKILNDKRRPTVRNEHRSKHDANGCLEGLQGYLSAPSSPSSSSSTPSSPSLSASFIIDIQRNMQHRQSPPSPPSTNEHNALDLLNYHGTSDESDEDSDDEEEEAAPWEVTDVEKRDKAWKKLLKQQNKQSEKWQQTLSKQSELTKFWENQLKTSNDIESKEYHKLKQKQLKLLKKGLNIENDDINEMKQVEFTTMRKKKTNAKLASPTRGSHSPTKRSDAGKKGTRNRSSSGGRKYSKSENSRRSIANGSETRILERQKSRPSDQSSRGRTGGVRASVDDHRSQVKVEKNRTRSSEAKYQDFIKNKKQAKLEARAAWWTGRSVGTSDDLTIAKANLMEERLLNNQRRKASRKPPISIPVSPSKGTKKVVPRTADGKVAWGY